MNTAKAMKPAFPRLATVCATVALAACAIPAPAATVELDASAGAGVYSVPGGTWDFGSTVLWTEDGGATRRAWTDNADTMRITLPGASAWGDVKVAVDSSRGAVGAGRIEIAGQLPANKKVEFSGDGFTLGAGGFSSESTNSTVVTYFKSPVTLTAAQTWRSAALRKMEQLGLVRVEGPVSSVYPIVFDGLGAADPGIVQKAGLRPGFTLCADNSLSAQVTVRDGAYLVLSYTADAPGPRLSPTSPLVLEGGTVVASGQAASFSESVPSVVVRGGHNGIWGVNGNLALSCGTVVREGVGGTVDFPVSYNGGVTATVANENVNGIIGGWATINATSFVKSDSNGVLSGVSGTQRTVENMENNDNAQLRTAGSRTGGDVSPNSLTLRADGALGLGDATVTIRSGGILSIVSAKNRLEGGTLKTGMDTGELFVHAAVPAEIASALSDCGDVPGILVKDGISSLRLEGRFGFTGPVYINSGTLEIAGEATVANNVVQAGGTTLAVADGGTLAPAADLSLGGNLSIRDGGTVALPLQSSAPITLTNRRASLSLPGPGESATLSLFFPDGVNPAKGVYQLVAWSPEADFAMPDLSSLALELPDGVSGVLSPRRYGIDLYVTAVPGGATMILLR